MMYNTQFLIKFFTLLTLLASANILTLDDLIEKLSEIYIQPFPDFSKEALYFRFPDFDKWERPAGSIKIGIQIGHWLKETPPKELEKISKTGAVVENIKEVDINYLIGNEVKKILENKGYNVEILQAIVPPEYYADAFIAIHSNSTDPKISGFMLSTPFIDYSGKAFKLKDAIVESYSKYTGLKFIDEITSNMTHYYAFNWARFKHAIHPKTPAVILEMGNMKNQKDLLILILGYKNVAHGIAEGIEKFIKENY